MTARFPSAPSSTGNGGGPETDPVASPALVAHAADTTDVHGIPDTGLLATDAELAAAVTAHEADTTSVHGIPNTAALVLTGDARLSDARPFIITERWKPTGVKFENFRRDDCVNVAGLASGQIQASGPFVLPAGASIASIGVWSGSTAAVTPTSQWFGLQDVATDQVVAVTADDGAAAWGANTLKTLTIAGGPWVAPAETMLRGIICVAAATTPSFFGKTGTSTAAGALAQAPKMCGRDTTVRTGPVAVGTVLTFSTLEFRMPYFQLS